MFAIWVHAQINEFKLVLNAKHVVIEFIFNSFVLKLLVLLLKLRKAPFTLHPNKKLL
jgi:hypothetical protein